jgi:hypothetical protein
MIDGFDEWSDKVKLEGGGAQLDKGMVFSDRVTEVTES